MEHLRKNFIIHLSIFMLLLGCGAAGSTHLNAAEVEIACLPAQVSAFQGEKVQMDIRIINNSPTTHRPEDGFFLSYHLLDINKKELSYNNQRFIIPNILRRNKTITCSIPVYFDYKTPGKYIVVWDIVKEGEFWGSKRGWGVCEQKLELKSLDSPTFINGHMPGFKPSGDSVRDHAARLLRITLKNCEIRQNGRLFGFAAGSTYPAVWIRDTATLLEYASRYYSIPDLTDITTLFIKHQAPSGEIVDWIDIKGQTGKNTVTTDQESSLALAAAVIASQNPAWLKEKIGSGSILSRVENALDWVWRYRRDTATNLITSAYTADWGDVDNSFPDERARTLSPTSLTTLGIYTQAKYIQAVQALIGMARCIGAANEAFLRRWETRLKLVRDNTQKHLYLPDKGYFLIHRVIGPSTQRFLQSESGILAIGGNAEAISAGLMSKAQIQRFLQVLDKKRTELRLRTVSFTLLPPYPENHFPHHLLKHPWSYQNGGEWDWIGARLVNALLENGFPQEGNRFLMEILRKNQDRFCLYEWEDRTGTGRGALFYAGAAGVLGRALAAPPPLPR